MSNFIKIPYDKYGGVVINTNELRKIEPVAYKNNIAAIKYYLNDEIIIQKFDYDYDPFEGHGEEWDEICRDGNGCNKNCEECKLSMDFEKKYKSEAAGYNRRTMNSIMAKIEEQLNVINIKGKFLEGELTVIEK